MPNKHVGPRPLPLCKVEVGPASPDILDKRTGRYHALPKAKSGIPIFKHGQYMIDITNGVYLSFLYTYQLCWNAYRYKDSDSNCLKDAKRAYYYLQRKRSQWEFFLKRSLTAKQFWNVISLTLRLAESGTKYRGVPLCGNNRDRPLDVQLMSLRSSD